MKYNNAEDLHIVALGGGTGLGNLLRVLKGLGCAPTAVVAMTDNGGSSGKLRADFGMLPPGDVRSCLLALSRSVLPVTTDDVALGAVLEDGTKLAGEVEIAADKRRIKGAFLLPDCQPRAEVLQAIAQADYIFIGPGSMYSSLISNLLVPGLAEALKRSRAQVYYISNMATEPGEMPAAELSRSVAALEYHFRRATGQAGHLLDKVIANVGAYPPALLAELQQGGSRPLICDEGKLAAYGVDLLLADFVDAKNVWQHNREKLAAVLRRELQIK